MSKKLMKTNWIASLGLLGAGLAAGPAQGAVGTLSGPFTHHNLQVFLVHGDTQLEQFHYATLSEGLEKSFVVVRETGNVQELSIENQSRHLTVFLSAGDIVKGGRQDRTVREDLILPPQSSWVPLAAFCVEHGRWTGRGAESSSAFSANTKALSTRKEKLAARYGQSQSDVWSGVAEQQLKLNENVSRLAGKSVDTRDAASQSSLQLTLENKELDAVKRQYLEELSPIVNGKTDVIGLAYAINGEINCAEVYNNKHLFRALWPKLLDAAVTEAITEYRPNGHFKPVSTQDFQAFFKTAVSGSIQSRDVWKTTRVNTYTTPTTVLFETLDLSADGAWLHKSFLNKAQETVVVPLDRNALEDQQQRPRPSAR
jgi:hypothetical protein